MIARHHEEPLARKADAREQGIDERRELRILRGLPRLREVPREAHQVERPVLEQLVEVPEPGVTEDPSTPPSEKPTLLFGVQVRQMKDAQPMNYHKAKIPAARSKAQEHPR